MKTFDSIRNEIDVYLKAKLPDISVTDRSEISLYITQLFITREKDGQKERR